jgi:hypothetical protein
MKHLIVTALFIVVVSVSCDRAPVAPVYGGGSSGSYANADRRTQTCVTTQLDPHQKLLFVIAWTAERAGTSSRSGQNLLNALHGHPVSPSTSRRALYALQPDHTLKEIPLNEADLTSLFDEMQKDGFHTAHSELWQNRVAPNLATVESPGGG